MVWPTLGSRTAKDQIRMFHKVVYNTRKVRWDF